MPWTPQHGACTARFNSGGLTRTAGHALHRRTEQLQVPGHDRQTMPQLDDPYTGPHSLHNVPAVIAALAAAWRKDDALAAASSRFGPEAYGARGCRTISMPDAGIGRARHRRAQRGLTGWGSTADAPTSTGTYWGPESDRADRAAVSRGE